MNHNDQVIVRIVHTKKTRGQHVIALITLQFIQEEMNYSIISHPFFQGFNHVLPFFDLPFTMLNVSSAQAQFSVALLNVQTFIPHN